jgi:plastocyanin
VFSLSSASFFTLAGISLLTAILTVPFVDDSGAVALLLFVALAAALAGLSVFGAVGADAAPFVPADAPAPEYRNVERGSLASGSPWPLALAGSLAITAVGLAAGPGIMILGIVLAISSGFAWLSQHWEEAPGWTPGRVRRVADRYVLPFAVPVLSLVLLGVVAISFSRILLAVDKNTAVILAVVAAVAVMAGATLVALRPGIGSAAIWGLAGLAMLLTVASGIVGAAQGEREFHAAGGHEAEIIEVAAESSAEFTEKELTAPANSTVTVHFDNREQGVPHNVAFYASQGGEQLGASETITGPNSTEFELETGEAGEKYFQCDVHPNMNGKFIVEEDAGRNEQGEGVEDEGGSGDH